ncbi:MAG TPA: hypothetical protein VFC45_14750 [Pseudolabrys sp.]|nr:hypothetical protein [Pseudolabrys sp.]
MIGAGIACLYMAYQYAQPTVGRVEPPPEWTSYLFGGLGLVCLLAGIVLALKLKKEPTPAATTDLKSPQGKVVVRLMVIGFIALVGSYLVRFITPEDGALGLTLSGVLLLIMAVCFVSAGRIARKMRATAATGAGK